MSKVSFREVVTMRTADPIFKDGALDRWLCPTPKEPLRRDHNSEQDGALVPTGAPESDAHAHALNPYMQQQMRNQGRSIDQISSSVNHLQDTMTDLKHSFTSLRIELNGPTRHMGDSQATNGAGFDMIATVLKELKSKSEEIEKLKLEIEALKLKNRFIEDRKPEYGGHSLGIGGPVPEARSPGLLQAGRKRAWPDAFPNGHTVEDSFAEEDAIDSLSLADLPIHSLRAPSKEPLTNHHPADGTATEESFAESPQLSIEMNHQTESPASRTQGGSANYAETNVAKRQRLGQSAGDHSNSESSTGKKTAGRPKKSTSQSTKPSISIPLNSVQSNTEEAVESNTTQVPTSNPTSSTQSKARGRQRRSTMSRKSNGGQDSEEANQSAAQKQANDGSNGDNLSQKDANSSSQNGNAEHVNGAGMEEKRKAKVAARDAMTRRAMQREEAMETDDGR